jgi:hypothetical protein
MNLGKQNIHPEEQQQTQTNVCHDILEKRAAQ